MSRHGGLLDFVLGATITFLLSAPYVVMAQPAPPQPQQPDPAIMRSALQVLEKQRNQALNEAVMVEAQLAKLQEENAALKKQVADQQKELKKDLPEHKEPEKPKKDPE